MADPKPVQKKDEPAKPLSQSDVQSIAAVVAKFGAMSGLSGANLGPAAGAKAIEDARLLKSLEILSSGGRIVTIAPDTAPALPIAPPPREKRTFESLSSGNKIVDITTDTTSAGNFPARSVPALPIAPPPREKKTQR